MHRNMSAKRARARAAELLRMVGIPDPERRLKAFPTPSPAAWPSGS